MYPASFQLFRPESVEQAVGLRDSHAEESMFLAGGHSLVPLLKLRLAQPRFIIDLGGLTDLKGIREAGSALEIGALTTHAELAGSALVRRRATVLGEAAAAIGDVQVRNRGTIGGSLAHAD